MLTFPPMLKKVHFKFAILIFFVAYAPKEAFSGVKTPFVIDQLPDGCQVYAVMKNGAVQDLYRVEGARVLVRAPCGAVPQNYSTSVLGDTVIVDNADLSMVSIYKWDGDKGLLRISRRSK